MRKQDYVILAAAIKKHRENASPGYQSDPLQRAALLSHSEAIARTFARFAHVDETEFLKACAID